MTSIIILTFNKLEYTKICINSIRAYTEQGTYEIIVVDNNSTDGTREWLNNQDDIKVILNEENVGFPAGCNQGIRVASGDNILLLNNDTVVTEKWLELLLVSLYSDESIGAVGPVTNNSSYYQAIPVPYSNLDEMHEFAKVYNRFEPTRWEYRLKLIGFCFLIKKEVVDAVGFLDEIFTPGNFEDDDYSFRILKAGYKLLLARNVFIHHFGSTSWKDDSSRFYELLNINRLKFKEKWGFDTAYSTFIRSELLQFIDPAMVDEKLNVLEVGCACGATLLEIKNRYKSAQLYGIELNLNAAAIAATFADIKSMNVENDLEYESEFFDYIIFADVLEHLLDPWKVLKNIRSYLSDEGTVIASIPNVMHFSLLKDVIKGNWSYQDAGLLDRTHLRFFTLYEIDKMFKEAGYSSIEYSSVVVHPQNDDDKMWVNNLQILSGISQANQFIVMQYLVKAKK